MPEMDGFETARRIKQRERTRGIPIVFLTAADADGHLALRGYAAGGADYLTKPIDPWVLRAKVAVLVDLWEKNRRVRTQAELTANYERRLATAALRVERALEIAANRRVDPVLLIKEVQAAGFELLDYSTALRRPDDELRYEVGRASVTGNSDRFALLFVKPD